MENKIIYNKTIIKSKENISLIIKHFLDLELHDHGIAICMKPSNPGLYVDYNSNVPWAFRVSRIKSLTTSAKNIC